MIPIPELKDKFQYRALGLVYGTLTPIPGHHHQGILVTADGSEYPATPGRVNLLNKFEHCLESGLPYWFYVNPQPRPPHTMGLSVIRILTVAESAEDADQYTDNNFTPAPDEVEEGFHIRGLIDPNPGSVSVTVKRKPLGAKHFSPLIVKLQGYLPGANPGEFWDLQAERDGHDLLLVDGTRLIPA